MMFRITKYIALICLLLISTTGFTITTQYCSDQHSNLITAGGSGACCDSGPDGCCHSEGEHYQLRANFIITPPQKSLSAPSAQYFVDPEDMIARDYILNGNAGTFSPIKVTNMLINGRVIISFSQAYLL